VPEIVGISTGMLITALHHAGLVCLIHTPNPMKFLNDFCQRPDNEKPVMIIPVGYPSAGATIPQAAKKKKPLGEILSVFQTGLRPKNSIGFTSVSRRYRGSIAQVEILPTKEGISGL